MQAILHQTRQNDTHLVDVCLEAGLQNDQLWYRYLL